MIEIKNLTIWMYQSPPELLIQIRCSVCGSKPEETKAVASEETGFAFALRCPSCRKNLVEYNTRAELSNELAKHVEKWRI
jgi:hypothetical protein